MVLVESDERKAAFLLQASKISPELIEIKNSRAETLPAGSYDVVISVLSHLLKIVKNRDGVIQDLRIKITKISSVF